MKFNYAKLFPSETVKMGELDAFLEDLSESYPEEFGKDIYDNGSRIIAIGINAQGRVIYHIHDTLPSFLEKEITKKLMDLWPL